MTERRSVVSVTVLVMSAVLFVETRRALERALERS